jgi:hypothetical protein
MLSGSVPMEETATVSACSPVSLIGALPCWPARPPQAHEDPSHAASQDARSLLAGGAEKVEVELKSLDVDRWREAGEVLPGF